MPDCYYIRKIFDLPEYFVITECEESECIITIHITTHQINARKEEQPDRQFPEVAVQKALLEIGKLFLPQLLTKSLICSYAASFAISVRSITIWPAAGAVCGFSAVAL